ncbi:hypothetical protein GH714_016980 [Hevea brasiliensis]|uniref:PRA1 family protein n=1 Tax=Hevea brasiliensis TaxID=3981 RepID=A0A6A6KUH3_HEVBR|nr:hypothetical protein GH714_016980 [Hevea brasiliensis]
MASPSPPILPISNPPHTTAPTAASAQSQPPIATPAFRAFINQISGSVRHGLSQRRPWAELVDRNAFCKPESFSEAALRVRKNYSYFRVNYLTVIALILAFSLLSHPLSLLLLLVLLASWLFLYLFRPSDQPLVLFGRTFTDRETLGDPEDLFLDEQEPAATGLLSFLGGAASNAAAAAAPVVAARV